MNNDEQKILNDSELTGVVGGRKRHGEPPHSNSYHFILAAIKQNDSRMAMKQWKRSTDELSDWEKKDLREMFFQKFGHEIDQ